MTTLVVDANGEATLRKSFLEQVGAHAGDMLEVEVRVVEASKPRTGRTVTWDDLAGSMVPPTGVRLTIEEIKEATEKAWAGER
jgi:hypothetical protein